jgi:hypothetical protein
LSLFRPDRPLEIQASSEVADQAEKDLSYCKLSWGSVSGDEPPALKFSALLTKGGAKRLELARA